MSPVGGRRPPPPPLLTRSRAPHRPEREAPCVLAGSRHAPNAFRPRMAGVRFPEVKEEGRRFFGPGDMEGIGHPPPVARVAAAGMNIDSLQSPAATTSGYAGRFCRHGGRCGRSPRNPVAFQSGHENRNRAGVSTAKAPSCKFPLPSRPRRNPIWRCTNARRRPPARRTQIRRRRPPSRPIPERFPCTLTPRHPTQRRKPRPPRRPKSSPKSGRTVPKSAPSIPTARPSCPP